MAIGSLGGRLHPMHTGGGGSNSGLPYGFPTLTTARFNPGMALWDDFIGGVSVGTTAASRWTLTQVGSGTGSAGLVTSTNTTSVLTAGVFQVATGGTANDLALAELSQRTSANNTILPVPSTTDHGGWNAMFRLSFGATRTTCKHGFGLIDTTVANGTDWITDPDTTLGAGANVSIVITRHTSAYGGAAAGDIVARFYDNSATDQLLTLVASANVSASPYKVEFGRPRGSTTLTVYLNGTAMGTFTTSTQPFSVRPSFGVVTEASARLASLDAYFLEAGSPYQAR